MNMPVRAWLRPSLLRRIVFTLMAALLLVWVALSLKDYWVFRQDVSQRESLGRVARSILNSLQGFDLVQAQAAMQAADRVYNDLRHQTEPQTQGTLLFRLSHLGEGLVYASATAAPVPELTGPEQPLRVVHQGMAYWPVVAQNAQWRLAVWVPVLDDGTALMRISLDLLSYVLLALPLVLLPLMVAVWLGLRPLHALSQRIAARPPDDLQPMQEPTGYRELAPLVDAFNALLERARHQRATEQAFVQDAAHELKTPLAVVAAQAHNLATAADNAQRGAALHALEQGVQRASHQVNQLLTLAALEHEPTTTVQTTDVVSLTREVLIDLEPLARGHAVELELLCEDTLYESLDAQALRTALVNLVRNAIQHGTPASTVTVNLERSDGRVCLTVCDQGPGIAPSEYERVFDRFYRSKTAKTPGSGLGLAIVQRAAQRLGAHITLAPGADGRGLCIALCWRRGVG